MTRTIYVLKTDNGYLTADGSATTDPFEAISFVDLDTAGERIRRTASHLIKQISICPVEVQFPKPIK